MHRAARLLSAYASAFSSGEANRVRLRTAELRTTGHTRARGRAPEAKRSLTAAAGEFPSCVAIWRNCDMLAYIAATFMAATLGTGTLAETRGWNRAAER